MEANSAQPHRFPFRAPEVIPHTACDSTALMEYSVHRYKPTMEHKLDHLEAVIAAPWDTNQNPGPYQTLISEIKLPWQILGMFWPLLSLVPRSIPQTQKRDVKSESKILPVKRDHGRDSNKVPSMKLAALWIQPSPAKALIIGNELPDLATHIHINTDRDIFFSREKAGKIFLSKKSILYVYTPPQPLPLQFSFFERSCKGESSPHAVQSLIPPMEKWRKVKVSYPGCGGGAASSLLAPSKSNKKESFFMITLWSPFLDIPHGERKKGKEE